MMKIRFINRLKSLIKSLKALTLYAFFDNDERAIGELKKSVELDPQNAPNLIMLGKILINRERYLEGIQRLKEALRYISDNDQSVPETLAYIAYGCGEVEKLDERDDND